MPSDRYCRSASRKLDELGQDYVIRLTKKRKLLFHNKWTTALVFVYGITEHPMMLAANKEIKSKDDVIRVARISPYAWRFLQGSPWDRKPMPLRFLS